MLFLVIISVIGTIIYILYDNGPDIKSANLLITPYDNFLKDRINMPQIDELLSIDNINVNNTLLIENKKSEILQYTNIKNRNMNTKLTKGPKIEDITEDIKNIDISDRLAITRTLKNNYIILYFNTIKNKDNIKNVNITKYKNHKLIDTLKLDIDKKLSKKQFLNILNFIDNNLIIVLSINKDKQILDQYFQTFNIKNNNNKYKIVNLNHIHRKFNVDNKTKINKDNISEIYRECYEKYGKILALEELRKNIDKCSRKEVINAVKSIDNFDIKNNFDTYYEYAFIILRKLEEYSEEYTLIEYLLNNNFIFSIEYKTKLITRLNDIKNKLKDQ